MPEPREARSIIEHAEQAAAAGNYASAEELLRQAADLQEQTLGPHHPDLANTLNNLGVVCEMADNPIDAEHYFRRACAVAAASLAPDHPFVATSSKNLHDFCAARGRPAELPPSPPEVAAWLEAPAPRPALPPGPLPLDDEQEVTAGRKKSLRPLALGALSGLALLILLLTMTRPWESGAGQNPSPPAAATAEPIARLPPAAKPAPPVRSEAAAPARPTSPTKSAAMPTVVTAQLCTSLRAWRCAAANSQIAPGPMTFYTRVKSATATTLEHRWYQGDRLRQTMRLRIQANPGAGYRTYSRNTITRERAGEWRVELRSADGAVLHEERFTVR
jgi:hypothetical protein